jgi:hypothetical protein
MDIQPIRGEADCERALRWVVKQQEILSLFGTIDYEPGYDYKRERKAKRV